MTLVEFLPIAVYLLLIVFLIVLIVLGIKLIFIVDKTDKILADVQDKLGSFNTLFRIIDITSDKLTSGVASVFESVASLINRLFRKRREEREYE